MYPRLRNARTAINRPLPIGDDSMKQMTTFIVPTYTNSTGLQSLLNSIATQKNDSHQTIVIDNGANYDVEGIVTATDIPRASVIRLRTNLHLCRAVNTGVENSTSPILAILNDDVVLRDDWLIETLAAFDEHSSIGSVASLVTISGRSDLIDSAGNQLHISGRAANRCWNESVSSISSGDTSVFSPSSACAAYRRSAFIQAGALDGDFRAYYEDVDLGFRMQLLGYQSVLRPTCQAIHTRSATIRDRNETAFLMERNAIWNLLKNLPAPLWRKHKDRILSCAMRPLPIWDLSNTASWVRGKSAAIYQWRLMKHKRISIQASRSVDIERIEDLLTAGDVDYCRL